MLSMLSDSTVHGPILFPFGFGWPFDCVRKRPLQAAILCTVPESSLLMEDSGTIPCLCSIALAVRCSQLSRIKLSAPCHFTPHTAHYGTLVQDGTSLHFEACSEPCCLVGVCTDMGCVPFWLMWCVVCITCMYEGYSRFVSSQTYLEIRHTNIIHRKAMPSRGTVGCDQGVGVVMQQGALRCTLSKSAFTRQKP